MPIRPEWRQYYGAEWRKTIRPRILDRDGHACRFCGKPNHADVEQITDPANRLMYWLRPVITPPDWREQLIDHTGQILSENAERLPLKPGRTVRVVLTIAHLDHNPANMDDDNLAALCQWCHLNYDRTQHAETRATRKDAQRPILAQLDTNEAQHEHDASI